MASTHMSMLQNKSGHAPQIFGRYAPGEQWNSAGEGLLWVHSDHGTEDSPDLKRWLFDVCGIVAKLGTDGAFHLSSDDFMEAVFRLFMAVEWRLDDGLALYGRIQRLAMAAVSAGDVLAFAAPESAMTREVQEACCALGLAGEDGLGHFGTQNGTFSCAWVPAWTGTRRRALRLLLISLAEGVWTENVSTHSENLAARPTAQVLVEQWAWRCVDREMRRLSSGLEEEITPVESSSSYRIMYRGEEDVMAQWRTALGAVNAESRTFVADSWLVWRTLRQSFQGSGWARDDLNDRSGQSRYHLELELAPPTTATFIPDWRISFHIAHNEWDASAPFSEWFLSAGRKWRIGRETLMYPDTWIFPKLRLAAEVCPAIERALQSVRPFEASLSPDEVFEFLTEQVPALEELGVRVRYPSLDAANATDIRVRVQVKRLKGRAAGTGAQSRAVGWFDSQRLVEFDWTIAVGDAELSREDFEKMVAQRTPLVQLEGSWRLIPIQAVLDQVAELRAKSGGGGNLLQLTRVLLMGQDGTDEDVKVDVSFGDEAADAKQLMSALLRAHQPVLLNPPQGFQGQLRTYQQQGFSWLAHLRSIACGGVLADDMGLGKTIQVLAYLLYVKEAGLRQGVHLLVCPTSLLQNWRAEMAKFAPDLRLHVHHGADRNTPGPDGTLPLHRALEQCDVIMTTYATVVRDIDEFSKPMWDVLIADEAQNVKNHETKQAKALRTLRAFHPIALTGTPIENRLEELWSIFQFTNPGYLGGLSWFRKTFVDGIAGGADTRTMRRLHQLLRPVLLRRSKTDPEIQMELPEKWEVREYAGLTPEQAALYQSVVNRLFDEIGAQAAGMSRRGQILTALVRLKQVCDHPCLAMGGSTSVSRSGKLKMVLDLMQGIVDEGESALVFTQFRDMGELLCDAFADRFGWRPNFLHGGLSASKRGDIVRTYQSGEDPSPVLVLSLKAGGVGLNLTRANHVFHYDRWWNPAVEDQATDRAFRIGQVRDVQVHKLVCPGTLEERIDQLIHSKRMLSSAVVGESEGWITDMDNESLRALFALDADAAVEDDET